VTHGDAFLSCLGALERLLDGCEAETQQEDTESERALKIVQHARAAGFARWNWDYIHLWRRISNGEYSGARTSEGKGYRLKKLTSF